MLTGQRNISHTASRVVVFASLLVKENHLLKLAGKQLRGLQEPKSYMGAVGCFSG
jgi:hypothetical protein